MAEGAFGLFVLAMVVLIYVLLADEEVWRRNCRALQLARAHARGTASEEERAEYLQLARQGVFDTRPVICGGKLEIRYVLSNRAIADLYTPRRSF